MYDHIIRQMTALPWAILPETLAVIRDLLALRASGERLTPEEIKANLEAARPGSERVTYSAWSGIKVIPVVGSLIPRGNMFAEASGAVSVQRLTRQFREALKAPDISGIIFDVDSPGGQVGGIEELATEIYEARGQKPMTAVANGLMASAAYWLASAADEMVVTPSGDVGSIGVFAIHQDISGALAQEGINVTLISAGKYKTEGNPFEPLGEEAQEAAQDRVDEFYEMFTNAVGRHRGVRQADVVDGFGQGRLVGAENAVTLGMADRVATIDEVISGMAGSGGQSGSLADDREFRLRRLRANNR